MKKETNLDTGTPRYRRTEFAGVVVLNDWMYGPDRRNYIGFVGIVSILKDTEIVGFDMRGNDSNWVARVDGEQASLTIPGCKVRGVWSIDRALVNTGEWMVVP